MKQKKIMNLYEEKKEIDLVKNKINKYVSFYSKDIIDLNTGKQYYKIEDVCQFTKYSEIESFLKKIHKDCEKLKIKYKNNIFEKQEAFQFLSQLALNRFLFTQISLCHEQMAVTFLNRFGKANLNMNRFDLYDLEFNDKQYDCKTVRAIDSKNFKYSIDDLIGNKTEDVLKTIKYLILNNRNYSYHEEEKDTNFIFFIYLSRTQNLNTIVDYQTDFVNTSNKLEHINSLDNNTIRILINGREIEIMYFFILSD